MWPAKLALSLLREVGRSRNAEGGSFWGPYIDILPKRHSVPVFFTREEIQVSRV
jgi:hypothetical protein